jgi:hypothetical protein
MSYRRIAVVGLAAIAVAILFVVANVNDEIEADASRSPAAAELEVALRPSTLTTEDGIEPVVIDRSASSDLSVKENVPDRIDRSGGVRRAAIDSVISLADVVGEQAESVLAEAALGHAEPAVREEAVHALAERGGTLALQTLQQALQDPSGRVRDAAIRAFVDMGGDQAASVLGSALTTEGDISMRVNVIDALGEIGGPEATRYLEQLLSDENDRVREAAAQWLAEPSG